MAGARSVDAEGAEKKRKFAEESELFIFLFILHRQEFPRDLVKRFHRSWSDHLITFSLCPLRSLRPCVGLRSSDKQAFEFLKDSK